ncbi:hypothetical protein HDU67_008537, partial [Dinochytrium kinnereticum]
MLSSTSKLPGLKEYLDGELLPPVRLTEAEYEENRKRMDEENKVIYESTRFGSATANSPHTLKQKEKRRRAKTLSPGSTPTLIDPGSQVMSPTGNERSADTFTKHMVNPPQYHADEVHIQEHSDNAHHEELDCPRGPEDIQTRDDFNLEGWNGGDGDVFSASLSFGSDNRERWKSSHREDKERFDAAFDKIRFDLIEKYLPFHLEGPVETGPVDSDMFFGNCGYESAEKREHFVELYSQSRSLPMSATFSFTRAHDSPLYNKFRSAMYQFSQVLHLVWHGRYLEEIFVKNGPGRTVCPCRGSKRKTHGIVMRMMDGYFSAKKLNVRSGGGSNSGSSILESMFQDPEEADRVPTATTVSTSSETNVDESCGPNFRAGQNTYKRH